MNRTRRSRHSGVVACAVLAACLSAGTGLASAADINSVVGPLPSDIPANACVPQNVGARAPSDLRLGAVAMPAASTTPSHVTVDGSARVSETWTQCNGSVFPRSTTASIQVALPPPASAQRTNVLWGSAARATAPAPALLH